MITKYIDIYFRLRFGSANAINTYSRLKVVNVFKFVLLEFVIPNLSLLYFCTSKLVLMLIYQSLQLFKNNFSLLSFFGDLRVFCCKTGNPQHCIYSIYRRDSDLNTKNTFESFYMLENAVKFGIGQR